MDKSRSVGRAVRSQTDSMRDEYPDLEIANVTEVSGGLAKVSYPHWPEGQFITVPVAGSAWESGLNVFGSTQIGFRGGSRQRPFVFGRSPGANGGGSGAPIVVDIVAWLQSNKDSKELPIGAKLANYLYEANPNYVSHSWAMPTRYNTDGDPGNVETDFRAYGLGRWQPDAGDDLYITAYPQKTAGGDHALCISAWGVASRSLAWEANFGEVEGNPTQYDFRAQQFFADALAKWATCLPDLNSSPSRACSAKSASVHEQTDLDKMPWNASLHSFMATVEGSSVVQSFLCLPGYENGTDTIDFWKMNQSSGAWTKEATFAAADLPDGGSAEVPDILPSGTDQTGPISWTNNEALIPVAGGTQDILEPENWTECYLGVRGVKPDGTAGARMAAITIPATDSPRVLDNASFKDQVLLAPFPLTYEFTGDSFLDNPAVYKVYGEVQLGPTTDSFYAKIPECPPIFMPPAGPNMQHLPKSSGLEVRMAFSNTKGWPSDDRTRPGRMPVDEDGTAWFCAFVPEPVLYYSQHTGNVPGGAAFSTVDTGNTATVYFWTTVDDQTECFLGTNRGFGWNVNSTFHPGYGGDVSTDPDFWPQVDTPCAVGGGTRRRSYSMEDKGTRPHFKFQLNLGLGIFWRTKMFGMKPDNSLVELDISQKQDVELSAALGAGPAGGPGSGSTTYNVTEEDVPTPDAVWDWVPIKKGTDKFLCILRDLHYERDGDCEPAPVLEVRNAATNAVLSTTRLGSQERREEDFLDEESGFSYREGDNVWNPYAFGAPRMKACRDTDGNPVLLILVSERKVIDVTTECERARAWYHTIRLEDPESPEVISTRQTSEEVGVGDPAGPPAFSEPGDQHVSEDYRYPYWRDWDTLLLTTGHVAWGRDSQFYELIP